MKIAILDADLIQNINKHRFPNLACMKISGYYKELGNDVILETSYENLEDYDKIFISKVFTETKVPDWILLDVRVSYGGTGFFYDKAIPLQHEIEHHMPDYHLYDEWVNERLNRGDKRKSMEYYLDFSIGFTTRGCMRQCSFCVNKNSKQSVLHSPVEEFLDRDRKYICLLDDNVLACKDWKSIFDSLIATNIRFQYKQGMDERLLTVEKCDYLFNKSKWQGDYIFAFDKIEEKDLIVEKLKLIRSITNKKNIKFYVFTGYNHKNDGHYDEEFYVLDLVDLFSRIIILEHFKCKPYVMRYIDVYSAPPVFKSAYTSIASWCNQINFFHSMTLKTYCVSIGMNRNLYKEYLNKPNEYPNKKGASWEHMNQLLSKYPFFEDCYNFKGSVVKKSEIKSICSVLQLEQPQDVA